MLLTCMPVSSMAFNAWAFCHIFIWYKRIGINALSVEHTIFARLRTTLSSVVLKCANDQAHNRRPLFCIQSRNFSVIAKSALKEE